MKTIGELLNVENEHLIGHTLEVWIPVLPASREVKQHKSDGVSEDTDCGKTKSYDV